MLTFLKLAGNISGALSQFGDVLSVFLIVNPTLATYIWVLTEFAVQSISRPYYLFSLYGAPGLVLYLFGSWTTWRTEAHILGKVDDGDSLNFKKSVQDECTMISVAVSMTLRTKVANR